MQLERSTDKHSLDLSSHYVVLGSGLNAISTIHGILDNCDDVNKKVIIIDASIKNGIAIIATIGSCTYLSSCFFNLKFNGSGI